MFCIMGVAHAKPHKFDVKTSFQTDAAVETIWDVLTDYNTHDDFMSMIESSLFVENHFGTPNVLLQTIRVRFWFFKTDINIQLEDVTETAFHSIRFHGTTIGRRPTQIDNAGWTIEEGKIVTFSLTLTVNRRFLVPRALVRRSVKKMLQKSVDEVKVEVERRDTIKSR